MHRHIAPAPPDRPSPRNRASGRARAARVASLLVTALALAGCGLRLETPPPAEPTPDAVETVRARTVDDALALAAGADAAVADVTDEQVRAVLQDVAAFSLRHAQEMGGVYDSGLPRPTPTASPTPVARATDVTGLVSELVTDAGTAAGDADVVPDGDLARLVASVAVARETLAARLAAAAGVELPERVAEETPAPGATLDATATPGPTPTPSAAAVPDGAAALALAHDEAAWTLTVLAARATGDARAGLLAAAARHRADSDAWASAAGVAGRPADPRRSAYALPAGIDDPTVADALPRTLEQAVADASAVVVAGSPAGSRRDAVDSLRTATRAAVARGAAPVPFPGMPELAAVPVD